MKPLHNINQNIESKIWIPIRNQVNKQASSKTIIQIEMKVWDVVEGSIFHWVYNQIGNEVRNKINKIT